MKFNSKPGPWAIVQRDHAFYIQDANGWEVAVLYRPCPPELVEKIRMIGDHYVEL